jgi:hypothetical protein
MHITKLNSAALVNTTIIYNIFAINYFNNTQQNKKKILELEREDLFMVKFIANLLLLRKKTKINILQCNILIIVQFKYLCN